MRPLRTPETTLQMSAVNTINPNAEVVRASHALSINVNAARGLQEVLKSNLGATFLVARAANNSLTWFQDQKERSRCL